jgi:hypothetical protein
MLLVTTSALLAADLPATQPTAPSQKESAPKLAPSPDYRPADVIRIQIQALQHNDDPAPDSGVARVFQFASPQNQSKTGPLPKFTAMVKSDTYGVLINHKHAEYGPLRADDQTAQQLVRITAANGSQAMFLFILSKQTDGTYKNCWMTDGVVRIRPEDITPLAPPPGDNGDGKNSA